MNILADAGYLQRAQRGIKADSLPVMDKLFDQYEILDLDYYVSRVRGANDEPHLRSKLNVRTLELAGAGIIKLVGSDGPRRIYLLDSDREADLISVLSEDRRNDRWDPRKVTAANYERAPAPHTS